MSFNVTNRRVHHWASFIVAIPLLVMIVSGLLLQIKKQWTYVQPPEHRGTGKAPAIDFDADPREHPDRSGARAFAGGKTSIGSTCVRAGAS